MSPLRALDTAAAASGGHTHLQEWQLGVFVGVTGAFVGTLGVQLRIRAFQLSGCVALAINVTGWVCWVAGQLLGQVAIILAPATIAACVGFSGSLFSNALLAPCVLAERLSLLHGAGVLLLALGGSAVTSASPHQDSDLSLAQLAYLVQHPLIIALASTLLFITVVLLVQVAIKRYKMMKPPTLVDMLDVNSFAFFYALWGASDLVCTKCFWQLMRLQAGTGLVAEQKPGVWLEVVLIVMLILHAGNLGFQVTSTHYGDALQNLPLFLGTGIMMQVLLCGTFFDEFRQMQPVYGFTFAGGLVLMMVGLYATSQAPETPGKPMDPATEAIPVPTASLPDHMVPIPAQSFLTERLKTVGSAWDILILKDMAKTATVWRGPDPRRRMQRFATAPAMVGQEDEEDDIREQPFNNTEPWRKRGLDESGPLDGPRASDLTQPMIQKTQRCFTVDGAPMYQNRPSPEG